MATAPSHALVETDTERQLLSIDGTSSQEASEDAGGAVGLRMGRRVLAILLVSVGLIAMIGYVRMPSVSFSSSSSVQQVVVLTSSQGCTEDTGKKITYPIDTVISDDNFDPSTVDVTEASIHAFDSGAEVEARVVHVGVSGSGEKAINRWVAGAIDKKADLLLLLEINSYVDTPINSYTAKNLRIRIAAAKTRRLGCGPHWSSDLPEGCSDINSIDIVSASDTCHSAGLSCHRHVLQSPTCCDKDGLGASRLNYDIKCKSALPTPPPTAPPAPRPTHPPTAPPTAPPGRKYEKIADFGWCLPHGKEFFDDKDGPYTLEECFALCIAEPDCQSFVLKTDGKRCAGFPFDCHLRDENTKVVPYRVVPS
jgi:hypothetical protein